jgi:hypothetical protein
MIHLNIDCWSLNIFKMNLSYQHLLPANFHDSSRVWIYQSSRIFGMEEALIIENILNNFIARWEVHGAPVKGYANLLLGQFIVLMADETVAAVSGCSMDSSVRVMKEIEQFFKVSLFDHQSLAFIIKDKVQLLPMFQLKYALGNNFITPNTLYFNNLVATKAELAGNWIVPVKDSWLADKFNLHNLSNTL